VEKSKKGKIVMGEILDGKNFSKKFFQKICGKGIRPDGIFGKMVNVLLNVNSRLTTKCKFDG